MSSHLGFLEVDCDAPPYPIVRACRKLGMSSPEDVRWHRKDRQARRSHGWIHFLAGPLWGRLLGRNDTEPSICSCGQTLPHNECYVFTFQTGEEVEYEIGQCARCRTIYWDKL